MGIFLLWATWAHEYMVVFVKKIDRHRTSGLFKRAGGDFNQTWSACQ